MSRVDDFDAFYHGTRAALLHQTYALTGNIDGAASAVEHAYAHAWSHWAKVAHFDDPVAWVRNEAWRVVNSQLPRRFHATVTGGRRRRFKTDVAQSEYAGHLRRLHTMPLSQRRVVILHHLAGLPADQIARQVGVATSAAANALVGGERRWAESAQAPDDRTVRDSLGRALRDLEVDTSQVTLMRASTIRRAGDRRQRRHTIVGVAAAAALLAGGGALIAQQPSTSVAAPAADSAVSGDTPTKDDAAAGGSGSAPPEPTADPSERTISSTDTLSLVDIRPLSRRHERWAITLDSAGPLDKDGAYTLCQRRTFADPELEQMVLREFEAFGSPPTTALQVMEQSKSERSARAAFDTMESWYTACQQEDVRLVRTLEVQRLGDEARVVVLREDGRRPKYSTVGMVRTGTLTTAVIATTSGKQPIGPHRLADRLAENVTAICALGDGSCAAAPRLTRVPPLPQPQHPGFLVPSDLPSAGSRHPWAATDPKAVRDNPSDTPCDQVDFGPKMHPRARIFVIPKAEKMPPTFGLSETVGRFAKPRGARQFVDAAERRVAACADREINARVVQDDSFSFGDVHGRVWAFEFELADGGSASYRVGLVQRGDAVAEVTLSPAGRFDMSPRDFRQVVVRAGERLAALP